MAHRLACGLAFLLVTIAACTADDDDPLRAPGQAPPTGGDAGGSSGDQDDPGEEWPDDEADLLEGACPLGATHACEVKHPAGCAAGTQYCPEGVWTDCMRDVAESGHRRALTDDPADCGLDGTTENTCDPRCHAFAPDAPSMGSGSSSLADWQVGSLGQLPAAALAAGLEQPCNAARDCQFDHRCDLASGRCVAYTPDEGNPSCDGDYDVALGVACGDTVPLCNRGDAPIPAAELAAFRVKYRKPPPYLMDGCALGNPEGTCPVPATADLAVGECISVPCTIPDDRVVYVDAGSGNSRECECGNNWTYDGGGACQAPSCGGSVSVAEEVKLTLFISMDTSGSMNFHRDCPYADACSTGYCISSGYFKNCNGSCAGGVCSSGVGPGCCWESSSSLSRWGAAKGALASFARDAASAGLGVAMKFWPDGTCQGNACNAIDPFSDATSCGFSPCAARTTDVASGDTLSASCDPAVADACAAEPRCCGAAPKGSCASSPCEARGSGTLAGNCLGSAGGSNICAGTNNVNKRCCGGWTGTCSADPCGTHADDLGACDDASNADVRATCDVQGYERCCGDDMRVSGAWGLDQAPCAAASGNAMRCRRQNGNLASCSTLDAPAGTPAAVAKAVCASSPSCCSSGWTASCVSAFDAAWKASHGGSSACTKQWDAACRDQFLAQAGADACTKTWDQACADAYQAAAGGACTRSWDEECVDAYVEAGGECGEPASTACNHPTLPAGCEDVASCQLELTAASAPGDTAEKAILTQLAAVDPVGGTPSAIAVEGAADFCRRFQERNPDQRCVVVFVSDGQPSQCGSEAAVREAAEEGFERGVYIYAVGISGAGVSFMNGVAQSGGTSAAFFVSPNATASDDLLAALEDIRKNFACSYSVAPGLDPSRVTVRWNQGAGNPALRRVPGVAQCGTVALGYYPGAVDGELVLCPSTCDQVKASPSSNVEITVSCEEATEPATVTEELRARCDLAGTFPRWRVLLYGADVPPGSSIRVRARTALFEGDTHRSWHDVVTIDEGHESSTLDSPVSLEDALGSDAAGEVIELELASEVGGGVPDLLGYEVQYTCADSE
jgi:hypothetical protein